MGELRIAVNHRRAIAVNHRRAIARHIARCDCIRRSLSTYKRLLLLSGITDGLSLACRRVREPHNGVDREGTVARRVCFQHEHWWCRHSHLEWALMSLPKDRPTFVMGAFCALLGCVSFFGPLAR